MTPRENIIKAQESIGNVEISYEKYQELEFIGEGKVFIKKDNHSQQTNSVVETEPYSTESPKEEFQRYLKRKKGAHIIIYTSRFPKDYEITLKSLNNNKVLFHGISMRTKEQERSIYCVKHGHAKFVTTFFGYVYCGRCGQQIGDTLASIFDLTNYMIIGHKCEVCDEIRKTLSKSDLKIVKKLEGEQR